MPTQMTGEDGMPLMLTQRPPINYFSVKIDNQVPVEDAQRA